MHGTLPYAYAAVRFLHARTLVLTLAYVHIYIRNCILRRVGDLLFLKLQLRTIFPPKIYGNHPETVK